MFDLVCVTSRINSENFLLSVEKIAESSSVKSIILREKDLSENEYFTLAKKVNEICKKHKKPLVIHTYDSVAEKLNIKRLHLSFSDFCGKNISHDYFESVGTSVHSAEEAKTAQRFGADYITAGHIFETDCKKGITPRGIGFLQEICESVDIPVYAIGGINKKSVKQIAGIKNKNLCGACVMSELMKSDNPNRTAEIILKNFNSSKAVRRNILLYAITDRHWLNGRELKDDIEKAIKGGATLVQLREKSLNNEDFIKEAEIIHNLCLRYGVPLIINDRVDIVLEVNAEGVHLGQKDLNPIQARKMLGENKIIGVTARNISQAIQAEKDGADYIGSGAVFGTSTKGDAVKMSFDTLREICSSVNIPVAAIGGITNDNILKLKDTGISGAALVSGIFAEKDIEGTTKSLKIKIEEIVNGTNC